MKLKDHLYGLMLRSGNDASVAIAEHIGGSVEGFVFLMNEKAKYLGMTNTHFANPHGLDEENHYSSAYDIAILLNYANQNKMFQKVSKEEFYQAENRTYKWRNKNKLLTQLYDYCTGGKTGFTRTAGRTLATTAENGELSLVTVTLDAPDDWNDHIALFEWGFNEHKLVKLENKGTRTFISEETFLTGFIKEDVLFPLHNDEIPVVQKHAIIKENTSNESLFPDGKIGKITFLIDGKAIEEIAVFDIETKEIGFLKKVAETIKMIVKFDRNG